MSIQQYIPQPLNSYIKYSDPNDEDILEQEEQAYETDLKIIFSQDINFQIPGLDMKDEEDEDDGDEVEDIEEYGEDMQIPKEADMQDLMELIQQKGPARGTRNVYLMSFSYPQRSRLTLQFQSWSPNIFGVRVDDKNIGFYTNFKGFNQVNFNMMNKDIRIGIEYMQHSAQNLKACKFTLSKKF